MKVSQKHDIETIISKLSKAELVNLVLQTASEYPDFEKRIIYQFAPAEDELASSKELIRSYIRQYKRHGFIQYRNVLNALEGAHMVLAKAQTKKESGDVEGAVMLSITVLSIVVDMIQYCDDSSGYVGDVIGESLTIIDDAVSNGVALLDAKQQADLYKRLMKEALHKRYEGWSDWSGSLMRACLPLCDEPKIRNKFEKQLKDRVDSLNDESWSSENERERIKQIQLTLIERYGNEQQAIDFIYENMKYSFFREMALKHLLGQGNYSEAIRVCNEGIKADRSYRGLVFQWREYLLQAYEGLGDIGKQRELMLSFVSGDHFEYYSKLKALYAEDEWTKVLHKIIETFEKQQYPAPVYIEILKEEKLYDKLLAYCKRVPREIQRLHPYLVGDYFDEVNEIYKHFIKTESAQSNNRNLYKKVCRIIKEYKKIVGADCAEPLIQQLKETHKNRPAFLEELAKLK